MATEKVLFLCTGNSCRSQLAEAILNDLYGDKWQAYSAGTQPAGYVHPKALQVLEEIGIRHDGYSKHVDQYHGMLFDFVITVCDSAAKECPLWLGQGQLLHSSFPDPALASGSQEEILDVFRQVRDDIIIEIPKLIESATDP